MNKSAMIRARIEPELKEDAEAIFQMLGLTTTEAITLFYTQVKFHNGLPFEIKIPNQKTQQVFQDTDNEANLIPAKNVDDMFEQLGI